MTETLRPPCLEKVTDLPDVQGEIVDGAAGAVGLSRAPHREEDLGVDHLPALRRRAGEGKP